MYNRRMSVIFKILIFTFSLSSFADCVGPASQLLKEKAEKSLFTRQTWTHRYLNCDSDTFDLEGIIHEAVHTEDLGAPPGLTYAELEQWAANPGLIRLNVMLLDGSKIGELQIGALPKPKHLITEFLQKYYPDVIDNEGHALNEFLELYIRDESIRSAVSFNIGQVTEFNGYIHGLRTESRIKSPTEPLWQRYGVLSFMFFFKAYLYQLKNNHQDIWKKLSTKHNSEFITALFSQAEEVLSTTQHCNTMDHTERDDLFKLFSDSKLFDGLVEVLASRPDLLKSILCLR